MSLNIRLRKPRRMRPGDPAIWVWAAVALMALVPLQHAVASRLERTVAHAAHDAPAASPTESRAKGSLSVRRGVPATSSGAQGSATP